MAKKFAFLVLMSIIYVSIMLANLTDAACCESYDYRCPNARQGQTCCGVGKCNLFCCGCVGGCQGNAWGYRRLLGKRDLTSKRGIQRIDQNGDNVVNKTEGYAYIKTGACGTFSGDLQDFEKHFIELDKNGDGTLTHDEIDGSSA